MVKRLIKLPRNRLYFYLYGAGYLFLFRRRLHDIDLPQTVRLGLVGLRSYR